MTDRATFLLALCMILNEPLAANAADLDYFEAVKAFHGACLNPDYDFSAPTLPPPLPDAIAMDQADGLFIFEGMPLPERFGFWALRLPGDTPGRAIVTKHANDAQGDNGCMIVFLEGVADRFVAEMERTLDVDLIADRPHEFYRRRLFSYHGPGVTWAIKIVNNLDPAESYFQAEAFDFQGDAGEK